MHQWLLIIFFPMPQIKALVDLFIHFTGLLNGEWRENQKQKEKKMKEKKGEILMQHLVLYAMCQGQLDYGNKPTINQCLNEGSLL